MINKGDVYQYNNHTYVVNEKDKKSYILEREDGVLFKASEKKLTMYFKKIKEGKTSFSRFPALEKRIERLKIFKINENMPSNALECVKWFERLETELSPENLSCDGELSRNKINEKLNEIKRVWKELEAISGEKREILY